MYGGNLNPFRFGLSGGRLLDPLGLAPPGTISEHAGIR
jgi:hypothetical protein